MKKLAIIAAAAALVTSPALAQNANAPGQDRVCLITWATAADAESGADATALSGKYLPRNAAEVQAAKSEGTSRVFDYSDSTQVGNTGTVTITNNDEERSFCEGPEFNPTGTTTPLVDDDEDDEDDGNGNGNGKATGNPGVGNPGNDKPVGNAGENPSENSNAGGNGNGQGGGNGNGKTK